MASRKRSSVMLRKPAVTPIATSDYPTPARRPAYGVLATGKFERTFGFELPAWQDALAACLGAERVWHVTH